MYVHPRITAANNVHKHAARVDDTHASNASLLSKALIPWMLPRCRAWCRHWLPYSADSLVPSCLTLTSPPEQPAIWSSSTSLTAPVQMPEVMLPSGIQAGNCRAHLPCGPVQGLATGVTAVHAQASRNAHWRPYACKLCSCAGCSIPRQQPIGCQRLHARMSVNSRCRSATACCSCSVCSMLAQLHIARLHYKPSSAGCNRGVPDCTALAGLA